jgi:hypothetical protein
MLAKSRAVSISASVLFAFLVITSFGAAAQTELKVAFIGD